MVPPIEPWLQRVVTQWDRGRQGDWEERAAIREVDGGYPRVQAELLAFHDLTKDRGRTRVR